ncbi:uncharacterized protein EV422DRAFT_531928 [Fimicolochytrium jonesii]|uniref:uncharacterized protein n=1 Tax=Fimicolochytrium jonesii TaxID=1396493 RepID=UPI0022FE18C0|nr:uncharacterized protein EV422DRAFT_531928 [Fimicolochytrium jonesii]KAI8820182.1 hypothetical protein EV422DRAFT_531928 [Fimicolochytrium jonesii]
MASHLAFTADTTGELNFPFGIADLRSYALHQPPPATLGSGSKWGPTHLSAFHVVTKTNLPVEAVVPGHLLPSRDVVRAAIPSLFSVDGDVVRDVDFTLKNAPEEIRSTIRSESYTFYRNLQAVIAHTSDESVRSASTTGPDLSSTTDEDKPENVGEALLKTFVGLVIDSMGPTISRNGKTYEIELRPEPLERTIRLCGGIPAIVRSDGWLALVKSATSKGSRRGRLVGGVTLCGIEAKRYGHEHFIDGIYGQLFAECLALAYNNRTKGPGDQETFLIGIHHRKVFIVHVFLPASYLDAIQLTVDLPDNVYVVLKRSRVFDLLWSEDRMEMARAVLAMEAHLGTTANLVGRMRSDPL